MVSEVSTISGLTSQAGGLPTVNELQSLSVKPGAIARSVAMSLGNQEAP